MIWRDSRYGCGSSCNVGGLYGDRGSLPYATYYVLAVTAKMPSSSCWGRYRADRARKAAEARCAELQEAARLEYVGAVLG